MIIKVKDIMTALDAHKARSAWERGVTLYAYELLEDLAECAAWRGCPVAVTDENMLNGAPNWDEFSWGGSSLIYDGDIAERLCTPSELRRKDGGRLAPNSREEWLDMQARALRQAARLLRNIARDIAQTRTLDDVKLAA